MCVGQKETGGRIGKYVSDWREGGRDGGSGLGKGVR